MQDNPNATNPPDSWHPADMLDALTLLATSSNVVVEVGTWLGHSSLALARGAAGRVYCVDHWRGSENGTGIVLDPLAHYTRFLDRVRGQDGYARLVPLYGDSAAIARLFNVGAIDVLFIDGDHRYDPVLADLRAWVPKVRAGGVVCGDDWHEVRAAVTDFFTVRERGEFKTLTTHARDRVWAVRV